MRNQLLLAQIGRFSDDLRFKATERATYDPVYDLTHTFPNSARSDQRVEAEFRDTYLDYSKGPFDLRLGKQQIVWGEAVGLFFADVVNAKDLREYVLPDFDLIRIPDWAADLEYSRENAHLEFVWIPAPEFNRIGGDGSEFQFPLPLPTPTTPFTRQDPLEPGNRLGNSELGGRASYLMNGWDMGLFYLYTWDKAPVYFRTIDPSGRYNFTPGYKRLHVAGATISKEVEKAVFKGEFVFNKDAHFSILDPADSDGVTERDFLDTLVGADYTFFEKWETNLQFMHRIIFHHSGLLAENEHAVRNSISFWLRTDFFNGRIKPEFLVISSLMEPDFLYRPKLNWKLNDRWHLRFGADLFRGVADGTFGKFKGKSRVYSEAVFEF
ncbi:MAG: hypothetical protein HY211_05045 [Candidatus Omnitrophica bacterium]|nr:hypothetical protein [Candidatus Omnitrophota bacterium]